MCSDNNLINITVDILEQQIRNRNAMCLVLDCRPFLAYNESHILNSINIHCPTILRRRKNGYLPLRTIIPDVSTRERLSSKYFHTVILYDELPFNDQNNKSTDESMINLVAKCLQQEADLKSVYVLDGGIQKFRHAYPQLCTNKEAIRNGQMNKSPIGNLTWPLKSNGLTLPNGVGLKICCNSVAASQTYLSGSSKYQILINNNNGNCAKPQLTCNNNVIMSNKNLINSSPPEDNNENILSTPIGSLANHRLNEYSIKNLSKVQKSIDTVDCPSIINHQSSHYLNNHYQSSTQYHINQLPLNYHSDFEHNLEQCATNQLNYQSIGANALSGSCSQLNQLSTTNTNLMTNHSMSLSNLTNFAHTKTHHQHNSPQQCNQCNQCVDTLNENRSWMPKFNSFGNDALEPVEILPHLLLGSETHASQLDVLKRVGVTALLNVSHSCPNHFEKDFIYKCIPVQDSSFEDISVYFDEAIQFIDQIKANHGRVLVHCHAGISRSATICMAYIMSNMKLRMEDAYEFVKNRRRIVSPNFNFMGQLLNFESIVFANVKPTNVDQMNNQVDNKMDIENSNDLIDANLIEKSNMTLSNLIDETADSESTAIDTEKVSNKLKNIFDFTANCNNESDLTINSKLDFNSIKKINNANTPLLSPT